MVERPLLEREVMGSNLGRVIPKALKMVPVATLLVDGVSPSVFRCTSTPMETGPIDACVKT